MIGQFAEMPNVKINKTRSSLLRHSVCTKISEKYFLVQTSHSVLAPSSLGLYKNFREILSYADLALGPSSFVTRSVQKLQGNTFLCRSRTRS